MKGAFRDLHFGIMSTFVNVKIVRFAVIVNKDRNMNIEIELVSICTIVAILIITIVTEKKIGVST